MWKDEVVAWHKILPQHFPEENEENQVNVSEDSRSPGTDFNLEFPECKADY
jgi:hypothetical protein